MWSRRQILPMVGILCCCASAYAQSRPTVVELFTSEGCSSCPPAERYMGELAQRRDVLPLSFHVDYWDDLGWRDRFSMAAATQRQRFYARSLKLSSVYTPQAVIDGRVDSVGSNRPTIETAIAASEGTSAASADSVPIALSVHGDDIRIEIGRRPETQPPTAKQPLEVSDVFLIGYLRRAISPIGRGENSGRTIEESNIVRSIQTIARWHGQTLSLDASSSALPREVTDVAVVVQRNGQGAIVGAAAHSLR